MVRVPCCSDIGLKKGPWTPEEDQILIDHVQKHGHGSWRALPKSAGLNRCGKSCRLRWFNYLKPDIKRGNFSQEEERIIINLHSVLGNKWSRIAAHLPGRTDNEIKNFWNTQLRKKLLQMGIDPKTHKPIPNLNLLVNLSRFLSSPSNLTNPIMMNPCVNGYTFQADATNQLARIQLLHNMLQVVNVSRLPKMEEEEGNNSNPARLYGPTSEAVKQSTMDDPSQEWFDFINKDTMESFEGGLVRPEEFLDHSDMKGLSRITCIESTLPGLVSSTSESSIVNQMNNMTSSAYVPTPRLQESNVFEGWEKLVDDDEAMSSFLKDIVD